jgi:fatty acid desaturase
MPSALLAEEPVVEAELPPGADVPPPTDNGRLPEEAVLRIRAAARWLPASLAAVVTGWLIYQITLPHLYATYGAPALLLVPTIGVFLFTWLGYYRHELWHNYFTGIRNPLWFNVTSYLLFSDPQVYRIAHPSHHKYVHTPEDLEFFCRHWRTDRRKRRRQFFMELFLGNIAWEGDSLFRLLRDGRASKWASRKALAIRFFYLWLLANGANWLHPGTKWTFLGTFIFTLWMGSVVTRQNQWLEHLGTVSDGSLAERNLLTRNLPSSTFSGWLFNFMNHSDATEHVFHHTEPQLNSRGLPGLTLPPGSRTVTVRQYLGILMEQIRTL